ncbi:hypothetical protein Tco_1002468 [Tanacetum coccineum]|uniref:Uncharacterized protein n=1 Tax=Tanacetum coccineum TaxID=301880 RepID=A0ABQ5F7P3_9ASTR
MAKEEVAKGGGFAWWPSCGDNARSCVMQCTLPTQGMRSIISTVSISPKGFLPSILLLVVIIVTVVIVVVTVILVVVVVAIIGVVIVVTIIGVVVAHRALLPDPLTSWLWVSFPQSFRLLNRNIFLQYFCSRAILIGQEPFEFSPGYLVGLLYSNRFGIGIPPGQGILGVSLGSVFLFELSVLAMVAACASRAAATLSATSCQMAA